MLRKVKRDEGVGSAEGIEGWLRFEVRDKMREAESGITSIGKGVGWKELET